MGNNGIKLNMDMAGTSFINGTAKSISSGENEDYVTRVDMILPFDSKEIPCQKYRLEYQNEIVEINIKLIKDKTFDPIMKAGSKFQIGTPNQSGLPEMLPFEVFTDNRGKYPALLASILFPFRIASWIDDNHETGIKMDHDYESIQITGFPDNQEKIRALVVINKLLDSLNIMNKRKLKYDDITVFFEIYFKKGNFSPLLSKISSLVSKNAYKNAVEEYYLKNYNKPEISNSIKEVHDSFITKELTNERDLFDVVNKIIEKVLIHHIDDRRWIEPFWDGERKIKMNGNEHLIPRTPKKEPKIQPTLHVILDMALRPFGIHVLRESNEGIGLLDFSFLYTNKDNIPISIGVEFKLAHHTEIKHGITKQLPSYLKSIRSKHGSFVVMWFKDEVYFKKPKKRNLEQMREWLEEEAAKISSKLKITISSKVINASIRPSASNL